MSMRNPKQSDLVEHYTHAVNNVISHNCRKNQIIYLLKPNIGSSNRGIIII